MIESFYIGSTFREIIRVVVVAEIIYDTFHVVIKRHTIYAIICENKHICQFLSIEVFCDNRVFIIKRLTVHLNIRTYCAAIKINEIVIIAVVAYRPHDNLIVVFHIMWQSHTFSGEWKSRFHTFIIKKIVDSIIVRRHGYLTVIVYIVVTVDSRSVASLHAEFSIAVYNKVSIVCTPA